MVRRIASYYPRMSSAYVPDMDYSADVDATGQHKAQLGTPLAAVTNGILDAGDTASGDPVSDFESSYSDSAMGNYGRNVTVVLSAAGTPSISVRGRDYLGQPMSETFAGAGTTPVVGKKAFKTIEEVLVPATASNTISIGWGNVLGLPYKTKHVTDVLVDGAAPTAGTFTAAVDAQTATSGDPRGTYAPHSSALPNGARVIEVVCQVQEGNQHGSRHFYA